MTAARDEALAATDQLARAAAIASIAHRGQVDQPARSNVQ
jgi:hypothetical protein